MHKNMTITLSYTAKGEAAEVKAHDSRPVAAGLTDIAAAVLVLPAYAVERIVLVPEHAALLLQILQALYQCFAWCRLRLIASGNSSPIRVEQRRITDECFMIISGVSEIRCKGT